MCLPLLLTALIVGFAVSLLQAVSSVQEQTLSSVPKMVAVFVVFMMMGPWYLSRMLDFFHYIYANIPNFMISN